MSMNASINYFDHVYMVLIHIKQQTQAHSNLWLSISRAR